MDVIYVSSKTDYTYRMVDQQRAKKYLKSDRQHRPHVHDLQFPY